MKKVPILLGIAAVFCLMIAMMAGSGTAYASSRYLTTFNSTYGTSGTVLNTCGICHVNPSGGGTRNVYGNAFAAVSTHSSNAAGAFATIASQASGCSGYTFLQLINLRINPGNPSCPTPTPVACTGYTYSAWSACGTNGRQTRTVTGDTPAGCTGTPSTSPLLTQVCNYVPPPSVTGISGVVRDIVTGAAISEATITDGSRSTTTNSSGSYSLNESNGSYTLRISKSGYLSTTQVVAVAGSGKVVNWALTKSYGTQAIPARNMNYVIFAWNDLGMHCDQDDYSYFAVLPPYNTLKAQVFRRGGEGASLITNGITVSYSFPKKKNSALHTNFWAYAPQFGWNVPTNVGITGTPLAGNMKLAADRKSWEAVGIPITPYDDDGTWDPYSNATITVKNTSGTVLQTVNVVAPVSTEMMCSNCHGTVNPQLDILQRHDAAMGTTFVADQAKGIVHLCSECHPDNALGMAGKPGMPSLSEAMHSFHQDKMSVTPQAAAATPGCYNCHPGQKTQCLRGIMARAGKTCSDCHGDMATLAASIQSGRRPWIDMPKCGDCHDANHAENTNTLYRNSLLTNSVAGDMNGRIYCEACHNSTHAELVSANAVDPTISKKFQGDSYWIWNCNVCHSGNSSQGMHRGALSSGGSSSGGSGSGSYSGGGRRGDD
jgi:uncharacterized membrane protein YgcG